MNHIKVAWHARLDMDNENAKRLALEAIARLWEQGCPVAHPNRRVQVVDVAFRRWSSFDRRNKRQRPGRTDRVEDLAKGLRDAFELDPRLVGRLMEDYRCLAEALADVLDPRPSDP